MTDDELKEIEARANAATHSGLNRFGFKDEADAKFYEYARTDIPALIAELRAAREALRNSARMMKEASQILATYQQPRFRVLESALEVEEGNARKALGEE